MSLDSMAALMLPKKSIALVGERQLDVTATKAMESAADKALAEMPTYDFHDGFEFAKADFVHNFADYWHGLDPKVQAKVLYTSPDVQA